MAVIWLNGEIESKDHAMHIYIYNYKPRLLDELSCTHSLLAEDALASGSQKFRVPVEWGRSFVRGLKRTG